MNSSAKVILCNAKSKFFAKYFLEMTFLKIILELK